MSEWITDRAPTKNDTSRNLDFYVWTIRNNQVTIWPYNDIEYGEPWMPITTPNQYVVPKRYAVEMHSKQWGVKCYSIVGQYEFEAFHAMNIPTREAAERIAAIYEEVMP